MVNLQIRSLLALNVLLKRICLDIREVALSYSFESRVWTQTACCDSLAIV